MHQIMKKPAYLFALVSLSVLTSEIAYGFDPHFKDVEASIEAVGSYLDVEYMTYDDTRSDWIEDSHLHFGEIWFHGEVHNYDGIVVWTGKSNKIVPTNSSEKNVIGFATYDPARGEWAKKVFEYGSVDITLSVGNGVVGWVVDSSNTDEVFSSTYDPAEGKWETSLLESSNSGGNFSIITKDGIVVWKQFKYSNYPDYIDSSYIKAATYAPSNSKWEKSFAYTVNGWTALDVNHATVFAKDRNQNPFTLGYDSSQNNWRMNFDTKPQAGFRVTHTLHEGIPNLWITDMSIGRSGVTWKDEGGNVISNSASVNFEYPLLFGTLLEQTASGFGSATNDIKSVPIHDMLGDKIMGAAGRARVGVPVTDEIFGELIIEGNEDKSVLLLVDGPALSKFGLDYCENPTLRVWRHPDPINNFSSRIRIAENESWEVQTDYNGLGYTDTNPLNLSTAILELVSRGENLNEYTQGSTDAALLLRLPPGIYTYQVKKKQTSDDGIAVLRTFQIENGQYALSDSTISGMAVRGRLGNTTADQLFGEFRITGENTKKVLLQVSGPSLAQSGLEYSVDPKIKVWFHPNPENFAERILVAQNDNWMEQEVGWTVADPDISNIEAARGQITQKNNRADIFTNGSKDASLLLSLKPGLYTCMVCRSHSLPSEEGIVVLRTFEIE